jgi:hypothetical protein
MSKNIQRNIADEDAEQTALVDHFIANVYDTDSAVFYYNNDGNGNEWVMKN